MTISLSYSKKLLLFVLTLSLIPLITLSIILYVDKIETETISLKNQLNAISETNSKHISEWLIERKSNVIVMAEDSNIISATKKLSDSEIEEDIHFESRFVLEDELGDALRNFKDFENVVISNAKTGKVLFYTDLVPPDKELKNQRHFQQAVKGNIELSEVFLSTKAIPNEFGSFEKNVPTFFISAPIQGEVGIEGVLTARVNLFKINLIVEKNYDFYTVDSYLVNSEGYFLSKPRLLGEAINSGLIEKRPELNLQVVNPDSNQFTEIFQLANSENTENNLNGYTNYLGKIVIGSISPVKESNWSYIAEIEKNEAFLGIIFIQILIISLISIVLLIIVAASFHFASGLTMPIKKLQNAAEQIIEGNLDIKTKMDSEDEIGDLSRSFENMVENLKKTTDIEAQLAIQQNLRKALDESSIISRLDNNGKITYVNDKFCEVSKYSKEELIGKRQDILRSKVHPPEFYTNLWETISNGKIWHGEICNKAKDGTLFWNEATIVPFSDKDGNIYEYVAVRTDITQQKNLAQKLIDTEKLSVIGQLSARLAHDLRNPLSIIRVALENLKMLYEPGDAKLKQFDKIDRSIDRITHQVSEVLDFVRGEPSELNKVKFSEILTESMDSLVIPDNIKVVLPKNDVELLCDKRQFTAALNNLILNGIQAIDGTGTVEITVEENDNEIIIQVKDSGKGIPKEDLDKIFEPLFTTKMQGTGLGLVSVKSIIEKHDSIISVTSPPTIFTITLPKTSD